MRVLARLSIRTLSLTNAASARNQTLDPGLMLIRDT